MTVESKLVMAAIERKTNIMKAFKISAHKFQCMIMVMMVSSESSWVFPETCILQLPTIVEVNAQKMVANRKKKFTSKVSFRTTAQLELEFKCLAGSYFNCLWFMNIFKLGTIQARINGSLVPRPFPPPVFERLQYANTEGEGLGDLVTCGYVR